MQRLSSSADWWGGPPGPQPAPRPACLSGNRFMWFRRKSAPRKAALRRGARLLISLLLISSLALFAQAKKGKKKGADNPEGPQIVDLGETRLAGEISGERVS